MFTGIVTAVGEVAASVPSAAGARLRVRASEPFLQDVAVGDSIAVSGVCLTAVTLAGETFEADVSRETLQCTAGFRAGDHVNLEKALRLADRLGGHLVSGHVDAVGEVVLFESTGENRLLTVAVPPDIARYIARKGSIALNGVSLTVNAVSGVQLTVNLIPHTLQATNLRDLRLGDKVNVEVDLIARYAERLLAAPSDERSD